MGMFARNMSVCYLHMKTHVLKIPCSRFFLFLSVLMIKIQVFGLGLDPRFYKPTMIYMVVIAVAADGSPLPLWHAIRLLNYGRTMVAPVSPRMICSGEAFSLCPALAHTMISMAWCGGSQLTPPGMYVVQSYYFTPASLR